MTKPPQVHPTSELGPDVELAEGVIVGPSCVITGRVSLGPNTHIIGHTYLKGPIRMGANNIIYPFVAIGFAPQDYKFDAKEDGAGVLFGDGNIVREHATIHRASNDQEPTTIGNNNMLMVTTHLAHDAHIGSRCTLAGQCALAGHATLLDQVTMGGSAQVAQYNVVGRLCFVGGGGGVTKHLPPFMLTKQPNRVAGVNIIGLRRSGMSSEEIGNVRWAYKQIYRNWGPTPVAIERLKERSDISPAVNEIRSFLIDNKGPMVKPDETLPSWAKRNK